jgi:hypothetical protein
MTSADPTVSPDVKALIAFVRVELVFVRVCHDISPVLWLAGVNKMPDSENQAFEALKSRNLFKNSGYFKRCYRLP